MQEELTDEEKAEREENALELALETEAEVNAYELARPKPRGIFMPYIYTPVHPHRDRAVLRCVPGLVWSGLVWFITGACHATSVYTTITSVQLAGAAPFTPHF